MSDEPGSKPTPDGSPDDPTIPLELEPLADKPATPIDRPSVLKLIDEKCPNCGAKMEADAVVCMACGYDLKANEILKPHTGVEFVEPEPTNLPRPEFIKPGGKTITFVIAGACVLIGACVAAVMNAPKPGFGIGAAVVLLTVYRAVLHTGTGLAGLWCASKLVGERFTHIDLAAARMFLAFSALMLIASVHIPIESGVLESLIKWPLAMGVYWVVLFALFRRSRQETFIIMLFHIGAMMFVELGVQVATWLETSLATQPR